MRPSFSPSWALFLIGFALWVLLSVNFQIIALTFEKLGLSPESALSLMLTSLVGSLINLPLFRVKASLPADDSGMLPPGLLQLIQQRFTGHTRIVVNVGGCLVPLFFSGYLLRNYAIPAAPLLLATTIVGAVSYRFSRPMPGIGITMPILLAPLTAAVAAIVLGGEFRAPLAYISGCIGVLTGADVLRLKDVKSLGAPRASIGGAGTFDGIFMTGLVAVLLT